MTKEYTREELIELGKKRAAQMARDAERTKAYNQAVKELIAAHQPEFDKLYKAARGE